MTLNRSFILAALALAIVQPIVGQPRNPLAGALRWRSIGPYRGGRVTAVAGVATQPFVYYMGATGGGVWKTEDAGVTWSDISGGFLCTGSVGAVSVGEWSLSVVCVGMGVGWLGGEVSSGDGVWRWVG